MERTYVRRCAYVRTYVRSTYALPIGVVLRTSERKKIPPMGPQNLLQKIWNSTSKFWNLGKDTPRGGRDENRHFLNLKPVFLEFFKKFAKKCRFWAKKADFAWFQWFHAKSSNYEKTCTIIDFVTIFQNSIDLQISVRTYIRQEIWEKIRRGPVRRKKPFFEFKACKSAIFIFQGFHIYAKVSWKRYAEGRFDKKSAFFDLKPVFAGFLKSQKTHKKWVLRIFIRKATFEPKRLKKEISPNFRL